MTNRIDNTDDVIDSRDIIARIEDLKSELEAEHESQEITLSFEYWIQDSANVGSLTDELEEYLALVALAEQAEGYGDWEHGEALIHRDYWSKYVQEFAEDIGAVNRNARWPNNHINWEAAAEELEVDYMSVDFDGQEYLMRA